MKNKIIPFYELIRLIKDNKAPKKIKYYFTIYIYNENEKMYYNRHKTSLFKYHNGNFLDSTVEILPEENNEWKDIEELFGDYVVPKTPASENEAYIMSCLLAH